MKNCLVAWPNKMYLTFAEAVEDKAVTVVDSVDSVLDNRTLFSQLKTILGLLIDPDQTIGFVGSNGDFFDIEYINLNDGQTLREFLQ